MIYFVKFKRVSYVTLQIDAETKSEAEDLAWAELDSGESYGINGDADWSVEQIFKEEE